MDLVSRHSVYEERGREELTFFKLVRRNLYLESKKEGRWFQYGLAKKVYFNQYKFSFEVLWCQPVHWIQ